MREISGGVFRSEDRRFLCKENGFDQEKNFPHFLGK